MSTDVLRPLDLLSTQQMADPALQEIALPMPQWLSAADQDVRDEYARQLIAYHGAANRLEAHLDQVLATFEDFVHERLAARISTDLGADIDPDSVVIDLPESVWRDYDIDPQFGRVRSYSAPWLGSTEREQLSLTELARRNFDADDEQMARRFDFAHIEQSRPPVAGLSATWVHAVIPQLNVTQAYRDRLNEVFAPPPMETAEQQRAADLLLEPYEREIQLQAFCESVRQRLSEEGVQMLRLAAQARTRAETDAAGLQMNWLQFKPGVSLSGEQDCHTLSGLCLICDRRTGRTLIWLPGAPADLVVIEACDPALARSRLIHQLLSTPALIDYLAERTLDVANTARHVSYINQALLRGFEGFIDFVPALDLQLAAQQLHARARSLQRMSQVGARSTSDIRDERNRQRNDGLLMYFRALLGVLPGIGTLISVQDGWNSGHEAAQAFGAGRPDEGLVASGAVAMSVLDVALSIVPGALTICLLAKAGRGSSALRAAASVARRPMLNAFEGYQANTSLIGARPQSGRDIGTLLKDGQLWIEHEGQAYAVYRRSGEQTLRLRKTAAHGYEPPVRFEHGSWVYHSDLGLKGGGGSSIAESLIANANPDPAFNRRHARRLLDQFEFPADRQRRMELDIAVHYQTHRAVPDWAQAYRRAPAPADTSPQPGPSGVKRKHPPETDTPAARSAEAETGAANVPASAPQPANARDSWKRWARPLPENAGALQQVEMHPPIFRLADEQGGEFILMDGSRYDVLPRGASQHPSIVFLKNPNMTKDSFSGLNQSIRRNPFDQPIMASHTDGQWTVHGPLFKRRLQDLVEQARPGMTAVSNRILAEKVFHGADHAHEGLTASRLINLRATLNAWQNGQLAPLVNLNDPLLMLEGATVTGIGSFSPRIRLSYGPSLQPFQRLDFTTGDPALSRLLDTALSGSHLGIAGKNSVRQFMSALISRAGYSLVSAQDAVLQVRSILLFRRPGQEQLYMLKMRFFSGAHTEFRVKNLDDPVTLSNRWIDEWLLACPDENALKVMVEARDQGRLIKLVGGIKTSGNLQPQTQVFVQRIAGDF